ncbi:MAG: hypothetical protein KDA53_14425 [Hyphomonas sp.]|nr:hypothetical protein [Hyphomonas sp.]
MRKLYRMLLSAAAVFVVAGTSHAQVCNVDIAALDSYWSRTDAEQARDFHAPRSDDSELDYSYEISLKNEFAPSFQCVFQHSWNDIVGDGSREIICRSPRADLKFLNDLEESLAGCLLTSGYVEQKNSTDGMHRRFQRLENLPNGDARLEYNATIQNFYMESVSRGDLTLYLDEPFERERERPVQTIREMQDEIRDLQCSALPTLIETRFSMGGPKAALKAEHESADAVERCAAAGKYSRPAGMDELIEKCVGFKKSDGKWGCIFDKSDGDCGMSQFQRRFQERRAESERDVVAYEAGFEAIQGITPQTPPTENYCTESAFSQIELESVWRLDLLEYDFNDTYRPVAACIESGDYSPSMGRAVSEFDSVIATNQGIIDAYRKRWETVARAFGTTPHNYEKAKPASGKCGSPK